ncbi:uncharacterized protein LOC117654031 isoform X2 [Thrips palmi]|uniref:Uncharacterized protein LOC117654031 isoform X2 n=1 Tax=Thrips palmi TaxID=161013 RepID=A0A6P9ACV4_THRPL|nr:uncharacterized protein LOC117654031 isoform X2 [Thrips palmi]
MSCCRVLFGLTLVIRTAFHLLIAGYAAMDLKDIYDQTSGTFKQLALKLTRANEVVIEFEFPLGFYVFCGVALFVLSCVYPWKGSSRSSLTVYAILHALYVGIVIYVVFIRTIIDLSFLRDAYRVMATPGLFPASLALDVLTFIAAVATSGKGDSVGSYASIFPLHRVMVLSPSSPRVVASVSTLPPYTQFQNESAPRQQNMA